jgi:predicted dinucleotide-binding enzyme
MGLTLAPTVEAASSVPPRLGIVGAGKLGMTLARAALAAGYDVAIAGSGAPEKIGLTVDVLAPGATPMAVAQVVEFSDTIVLAIPTRRFRELPGDLFDGKILIDAMNYWPDTDGEDQELVDAPRGSSTIVQQHFPAARVVKSLNQLSYHQLDELPRAHGAADRVAMATVGDDRVAVRSVMHLVDALGFDPVDGGLLATGRLLEPDGSPYAITYTAPDLARRLAGETTSAVPVPSTVGRAAARPTSPGKAFRVSAGGETASGSTARS